MILEIPFIYTARVVLPRRRNEVDIKVVARVPMRVREIPGEGAPVAVRAAQRRLQFRREIPADLPPVAYRGLDGGLVKPLEIDLGWRHAHAPWDPVGAADAQRLLDAWHRRALEARPYSYETLNADCADNMRQWCAPGGDYHLPPFHDEATVRTRRWISDDRERVLARVRDLVERRSAFVDGVLHVPSEGPVLIVRAEHYRDDPGGRWGERIQIAVLTERAALSPDDRRRAHRPDRMRDAREEALRMAAAANLPVAEGIEGTIEVPRPDLLAPDDLESALRGAAQSLISQVSGDVPRMPTDAIRIFADLRDALDASAQGMDGLQFDSMLMLATDLDERWSRFHKGRPPNRQSDPIADFRRRLQAARGGRPAAGDDVALGADDLRGLGLMR